MCADLYSQEGEYDLSLFPSEETYSAILFIYAILHHPTNDYVCAGSNSPSLGRVLRSGADVDFEYPAITEVASFPCPISPLREHHVGDEIQCHDFWPLPTQQFA